MLSHPVGVPRAVPRTYGTSKRPPSTGLEHMRRGRELAVVAAAERGTGLMRTSAEGGGSRRRLRQHFKGAIENGLLQVVAGPERAWGTKKSPTASRMRASYETPMSQSPISFGDHDGSYSA